MAFVWCACAPAGDARPLVFGVFPYLPAAQLEAFYATIAAGQEVQLRTRPSFDLFREEVVREHYDLVFIQPFFFVDDARAHGYQSVARTPQSRVRGAFGQRYT